MGKGRVFMQQLAEEPVLFPQAATPSRVSACLAAEQQKLREKMAKDVVRLDRLKKAEFLSAHVMLETQNHQLQKRIEKLHAKRAELVDHLNAQCCPFSDLCGLTGAATVLMD